MKYAVSRFHFRPAGLVLGIVGALGDHLPAFKHSSCANRLPKSRNGFVVAESVTALTGSGSISANGYGSTSGSGTGSLAVQSGNFVGRLHDGVSGGDTGVLSLIRTISGTLTLSGTDNAYSGGTQIEAGTVAAGNGSALGTGTVTLSGGGTVQADVGTSSLTLANAVAIGTGGGTIDSNGAKSLEVTGNISEAVAGGGTLTLINSIGTPIRGGLFDIILSGANGNTGGSLIAGNTIVQSNASNALGTGAFQLDPGGNFFLGRYGQAVTVLTGSGVIAATGYQAPGGSAQAALTVQSGSFAGVLEDGNSSSPGGNFTGTLALVKTTTGTLTLSGANNTYSGGTQLQAGTIEFTQNEAFGSGTLAMRTERPSAPSLRIRMASTCTTPSA